MESEFWQDAEHRVQRARDLLRRRQLPEALEELRAAAELDPTNPIHHFELGRCLDLVSRHDPQLGGAHFRLTIPSQTTEN